MSVVYILATIPDYDSGWTYGVYSDVEHAKEIHEREYHQKAVNLTTTEKWSPIEGNNGEILRCTVMFCDTFISRWEVKDTPTTDPQGTL